MPPSCDLVRAPHALLLLWGFAACAIHLLLCSSRRHRIRWLITLKKNTACTHGTLKFIVPWLTHGPMGRSAEVVKDACGGVG